MKKEQNPGRPKVSVIIRTKNEEQWIAHCLRMVFSQTIKDIEVVIVDSQSSDNTLEIARNFPVKIMTIDKYYPGQALNIGIKASSGEFIACLSSHCIPKSNTWLENLLENFNSNADKIAGVYGRQIPFKYSSDVDKRDLLITFGLDRRIQEKDTFFHNANSMIPRSVWEQIPFDEEVTNIEDRVWGQEVIKSDYKIAYEPEAEVFHCHGIHHGNEKQRYEQTVKIMENLHVDFQGDIPDSFKPGQSNVVALIPLIGDIKYIGETNLLLRTLNELKACPHIKDIVVISERDSVLSFAKEQNVKGVKRGTEMLGKGKSMESTLCYALEKYESLHQITDNVLYANYYFPFRPKQFFKDLIERHIYSGADSTIAAVRNYRVLWIYGDNGYRSEGENFKPREEKRPIYEGLQGLGCITSSRFIRKSSLLGDNIELLDIVDSKCALKVKDTYSEEISRYFLEQELKSKKIDAIKI